MADTPEMHRGAMRIAHGSHRLIDLDACPGASQYCLMRPAAADDRPQGFPEQVRDACGVALLADVKGRPGQHILPLTLSALRRLAHRGAVGADGRTGDGAGVLTQIPFDVLRPELDALGLARRGPDEIAVGLAFLPFDRNAAHRARRRVADAVAAQDLIVAGWRVVPIDETALGETARLRMPRIEHIVVIPRLPMTGDELEQRLFRVRRAVDARSGAPYLASLSHRTLVYKALVCSPDLAAFYTDLRHPDYATSFAIAHQRFSTNTLPSWAMTQPFRLIAHNGEINTISGNRSRMLARGIKLTGEVSDSASLDDALSMVAMAGRELAHAMTLFIPPAWENDARMAPPLRALLDYQASLMEPWDGPALVAFSDGRVAGATLDRNGLRPARYVLTDGELLVVASEAGVLDVDDRKVIRRGRIGPGEMLVVDLEHGGLRDRDRVLRRAAGRRPYRRWLDAQRYTLEQVRIEAARQAPFVNRARERETAPPASVLRAFGYTHDELQLVLSPMYKLGAEPLASMGDDTPLAVLSSRPRLLFSYFRQRFAQVTNPPIDPLREGRVMSVETRLGPTGDLFASDGRLPAPQVLLRDPLLDPAGVRVLLTWQRAGWSARELSLLFDAEGGEAAFAARLEDLLGEASELIRHGATCLVLTDRGVDTEHAAIPSLLGLSALHQHLIREGLRLEASLVVDAGDARDDHHLAALLGFGADAVCPRLALELISDVVRQSGGARADVDDARLLYRGALAKGLLKILSKMGVSTLRSYRGAQLFEAIGIHGDLINAHFTGTPSLIGGLGLADVAREVLARHTAAFAPGVTGIEEGGIYRYRNGGETHTYEPRVVKALHRAAASGERLDYRAYAELVHSREPVSLRDLLEFRPTTTPMAIEDVEPVATIARSFMTSAMSLGALSPEAQDVLRAAMHRLGARSNCGEGGELTTSSHRIKQIASGRFGVTAAYVAGADELQIKIAQGSKPGEGGQLPGEKVTPLIAEVRHAAPGTTLISPPPHHDIYSIEDLAQLIYDLKQVNRHATVSVKLVSSAGIGTIAVGVAKAHADAIEISGHDGGTGASPIGSIKNAGTPWELGLAEAHHALVRAGLRSRVRLQVNGGLKTGRDVVIGALLGAEEFGFGTAALVAAGCVMARQCHLNTCPAGIATQRDDLRAKFNGTPDHVVRFFAAVAEEVREILALLGARALRDIVGQSDLLEQRPAQGGKRATLRLDCLLTRATGPEQSRCSVGRNEPPATGGLLDDEILKSLDDGSRAALSLQVTNADRTVGGRVAGHLAGNAILRPVHVSFRGAAGQSFGAFCTDGMTLDLRGEANDGAGKSMSGGTIIIRHGRGSDVLAGNAVLYGATGGRLFIAGRAGERFAVRNSGAHAVVEGTGDHACEYMTAGVVAILGPTGVNLGAGMTGGTLFVADAHDRLRHCIHGPSVGLSSSLSPADESLLEALLAAHYFATHSRRAASLLARWEASRHLFRRVLPARELAAMTQSPIQVQRTSR